MAPLIIIGCDPRFDILYADRGPAFFAAEVDPDAYAKAGENVADRIEAECAAYFAAWSRSLGYAVQARKLNGSVQPLRIDSSKPESCDAATFEAVLCDLGLLGLAAEARRGIHRDNDGAWCVRMEAPVALLPARTAERQTFLADVLITFVESRPYSWFEVRNYKWCCPDLDGGKAEPTMYGDAPCANAYADLRAEDPNGEGFLAERKLDTTLIEAGCERLARGPIEGLHEGTRGRLIAACAIHDAGDIDVDDADVILQAAVYGAIHFS